MAEEGRAGAPSWVEDYALFLLDVNGLHRRLVFGRRAHLRLQRKTRSSWPKKISVLYPSEDTLSVKLQEELKRTAAEGHLGSEAWNVRKDGSRFWGNVITMALKNENGELQGFAESGARLQRAA